MKCKYIIDKNSELGKVLNLETSLDFTDYNQLFNYLKNNNNALQERFTEKTVSRTGEAGENFTQNGRQIRQGEQGKEFTRKSKEEKSYEEQVALVDELIANDFIKTNIAEEDDINLDFVLNNEQLDSLVNQANDIIANKSFGAIVDATIKNKDKAYTFQNLLNIASQYLDTNSAKVAEGTFGKDLIYIAIKVREIAKDSGQGILFDLNFEAKSNPVIDNDIINSIAYKLINNKPQAGVTNKEQVKQSIQTNLKALQSYIGKLSSVANPINEVTLKLNAINKNIDSHYFLLDNYDTYFNKATDFLKSLDFVEDDNGYYYDIEQLLETGDYNQFDSESNLTKNPYDSIPANVKRFLYFIENVDTFDRAGNPIIKANNLGYAEFNDVTDTYTKLMDFATDLYLSNDINGINKLLDTLSNSKTPILRQLGNKLKTNNNPIIAAQLLSNVMKFKANHETLSVDQSLTNASYNQANVYVKGFVKTIGRIFKSNRKQGQSYTLDVLKEQFLNTTKLFKSSIDKSTGLKVKTVDISFVKSKVEQLDNLINDISNYKEESRKVKKQTVLLPSAKRKVVSILNELGIGVTYKGFSYLLNEETFRKDKSVIEGLFLNKGKILDNLTKEVKKEELSDNTTLLDLRSPFNNNGTEMNKIARAEYNASSRVVADTFRFNQKQYYPFIRSSYFTDLFQKLADKTVVESEEFKRRYDSTLGDVWSRTSNIIQEAMKGNAPKLTIERGLVYNNNKVVELKDATPKEHYISKLLHFFNQGRKTAKFFADTHSDKTVKYVVELPKVDFNYDTANQSVNDKSIQLQGDVVDRLYTHFKAEYARIVNTYDKNAKLDDSVKIQGYHTTSTQKGIGDLFIMMPFLNKQFIKNQELVDSLYIGDKLVPVIDTTTEQLIKKEINDNIADILLKNKQSLINEGIFYQEGKQGKWKVADYVDFRYLMAVVKKLDNLINPELYNKIENQGISILDNDILEKIMDYIVVDYVTNYAIQTNEMLLLTGDPAQYAKVKSISNKAYNELTEEDKNTWIKESIKTTLSNISKRNAGLIGSGDKGMNLSESYNVSYVSDIITNSLLVKDYLKVLDKKLVDKYYGKANSTDGLEFTTVKEHLRRELSFGRINPSDYISMLKKYDIEQFNKDNALGFTDIKSYYNLSEDTINTAIQSDTDKVLQPMKPMQRGSLFLEQLGVAKEYYIKSSSVPLIPSLLSESMNQVLNSMKSNGVDRLVFASASKMGTVQAKSLFNSQGQFNENAISKGVVTLPNEGFRLQLVTPYVENDSTISQGTQVEKSLFADKTEDSTVNNQTIKSIKQKYKRLKKELFNLELDRVIKDLGLSKNRGFYSIQELPKFIDTITMELQDKQYAQELIDSLSLNNYGELSTPLTFNINSSTLEPVITSIFTNRLIKSKVPGKSYVQTSESMLFNGSNVSTDITDSRSIIWTKPEYKGTTKLQHTREVEGKVMPSQVILPFYMIDEIGKKYDSAIFSKDGVIDTNLVSEQLFNLFGFRIPTQGANSISSLEIIGFLPKGAGDTIIVPAELATQMNADYDIDKLYVYNYNYDMINGKLEKLNSTLDYDTIYEDKIRNRDKVIKLAKQKAEEINSVFSTINFNTDADTIVKDLSTKDLIPEVLSKLGLTQKDINIPSRESFIKKVKENELIDIYNELYTSNLYYADNITPVGTDSVEKSIELVNSKLTKDSDTINAIFDPSYQTELYLKNRVGQIAIGAVVNANNLHSISQESNLFYKGRGVVFANEFFEVYNDEPTNTNNSIQKSSDFTLYNERKNTEPSAWKFDKVYTYEYTDPTNGKKVKPIKISSILNELIGAAADNSSNDLLGRAGMNKYNLATALTIIKAGYDTNWAFSFINQPILQEYYKIVEENDSLFKVYAKENVSKEVVKLIDKYEKAVGYTEGMTLLNNIESIEPITIKAMYDSLGTTLDETSNPIFIKEQLNILKAFLHYKNIASEMSELNSILTLDTKGLPKSIYETVKLSEKIDTIEKDSNIGNVSKIRNNTTVGNYLEVPNMVTEITTQSSNPIFAYNSPAYSTVESTIANLLGQDSLSNEQREDVFNELKKFIYSSSEVVGYGDTATNRKQILDKLNSTLEGLKSQYPNNYLVSLLQKISNEYADDIQGLTLKVTEQTEEKLKTDWLNLFNSSNPIAVDFAQDLARYAITTSPFVYGQTNILRYVPREILSSFDFDTKLNNINRKLNDETLLLNFAKQYFQHNVNRVKKVNTLALSNIQKAKVEIEGSIITTKIIDSFTLPTIGTKNNPASNLIINEGDTSSYPKFLRLEVNDRIGSLLYEQSIDNGVPTYTRIDKLGNEVISEYDFAKSNADSIIASNQSDVVAKLGINIPKLYTISNVNLPLDQQYIGENAKANDVIQKIYQNANKPLETSSNVDVQGYQKWIKAVTQELYLPNIPVVIDNSMQGVNGRMYYDMSTGKPTKIAISSDNIKKYAQNRGIPYELALQLKITHELLHAATKEALSKEEFVKSKEYKNLLNVHETYKAAIDSMSYPAYEGSKIKTSQLVSSAFLHLIERGKINDPSLDAKMMDTEFIKEILRDVEVKLKQRGIDTGSGFATSNLRVSEFAKVLREQLKRDNLAKIKDEYYGYVKIDEFITESFTNPEFQATLKTIKGKENKSLLRRLADIISKALNEFLGGSERTLLNDAVEATMELIDLKKTVDNETLERRRFERGMESIEEIQQLNELEDINLVSLPTEIQAVKEQANVNYDGIEQDIEQMLKCRL